MVELQEFLTLGDSTLVYVFDSHRPLHLHNMFSSKQVDHYNVGGYRR
jgi:hypothetical protein